ncbi:trihelix transcription factor [Trifolium pratense]|uniref:Trihelix transcription factor n=1 Tax=Trifolium pratense TaxID=57577 RepID=A0A2K3NHL3_TRIPR|nr:trihelix transcription factor [Trifolium pratense]
MLDEGEGGAEQFELEQLRLRRTTTTNTTSSSTSLLLHSSSATNNNTFHYIPLIHPPNYNNNNHPSSSISNSQFQTQTNFFPPSILLPHHSPTQYHNNTTTFNSNFQIQSPSPMFTDSTWTNHELLALFKITSTIHNFFPDQLITWDHVSRKLAEVGINKSAEKCKDKFEDDNISSFFKIHNNHDHNYPPRFISELQDLYQGGVSADEQQNSHEKENTQQHQEENSRDGDDTDIVVVTKQCDDDDDDDDKVIEKSKRKKWKRRNRFEMLKSFCETVVNKMMAQQEEIHNKLLEDMLKRDQEKLAREEEWKNQEIERMNMMAKEQAIASDRQSTIIHFLNKYLSTDGNGKGRSSSQNPNDQPSNNLEVESTPSSSNVIAQAQQNPSSSETVVESNYTSTLVVPTTMEKLEDRRRWPRDEVLALINLKSTTSVINRSNNVEEKEGNSNIKGPLWERISEGMLEMGYKRSAKRCKEKWENINKYFKKTKDVVNKKKRSLDSRTCPYFHQLSSLYNQQQEGKLIDKSQSQSQLVTNPISNSADKVDDQPQAESSDSPVGSSVV